jgi:diaminopimelate epimerase
MKFHKYSSTGNDFIILNHNEEFVTELPSADWIKKICKRRVSVGADGLILVKKTGENAVKMTYYNSDGNEVEMCGNGLRAVARYCHEELKLSNNHPIQVHTKNAKYDVLVPNYLNIKIKMTEIDTSCLTAASSYDADFVTVGVPHVVKEYRDISNFPLDLAKEIRADFIFSEGTNVNFYTELSSGNLRVRTFERGVESETLSCGTGVTATAFIYMKKAGVHKVSIQTEGGQLIVSKVGEDIFLEGPSELVFKGELS